MSFKKLVLALYQLLSEIQGLRKDMQDMSAATDRLAASITALDETVQKAVTDLGNAGGGTQAAVDAVANQAADAIDAANTKLTNALPAG